MSLLCVGILHCVYPFIGSCIFGFFSYFLPVTSGVPLNVEAQIFEWICARSLRRRPGVEGRVRQGDSVSLSGERRAVPVPAGNAWGRGPLHTPPASGLLPTAVGDGGKGLLGAAVTADVIAPWSSDGARAQRLPSQP